MSRRTRDHPREYGENVKFTRFRANSSGPSPRIRGKCEQQSAYRHPHGTIPANTGRMPGHTLVSIDYRDHPREYGENLGTPHPKLWGTGPSPRIRGEFEHQIPSFIGVGTIPANTGRILIRGRSWPFRGDHPREYGENTLSSRVLTVFAGPSPRIRGESTKI